MPLLNSSNPNLWGGRGLHNNWGQDSHNHYGDGRQEQHIALLIKDTSSSIHHFPLPPGQHNLLVSLPNQWTFLPNAAVSFFRLLSTTVSQASVLDLHLSPFIFISSSMSSFSSKSLNSIYMLMTLNLPFNFIFCFSVVFLNMHSYHKYFAFITPTLIQSISLSFWII